MAKYTTGNEFVLLNGKNYKGSYCLGPDGEYYTGKQYVFGISMILKRKKIYDFNTMNKTVFEYDKLESKYSKKNFINLKSYFPNPTDKQYEDEIIVRYFARKANDKNASIIEISPKLYKKIINCRYYICGKIKWKIAGHNIADYNNKQINESEFPKLITYLKNPIELSIRKRDDII